MQTLPNGDPMPGMSEPWILIPHRPSRVAPWLYQRLRQSFRTSEESSLHGSMLEFHLARLKAEFEESHSAAKLQPKHNKSSMTKRVHRNPYPAQQQQ